MMEDVLLILSLSVLAWMYAGSYDLEPLRFNFKPFNCPLCMGIWIGLAVFFLKYGICWKLLYCFIVGYVSNIIGRYEE